MESNNEILLELDRTVNELDLDVLILFFENKKKSGGGDSVSAELMPNKRSIKIVYEESQAKKAVFDRKIFKFESYLIRASVSCGYKNEEHELDEFKIIFKNIDKNENKEIVKMYAENLQPDNEVYEICQFETFEDVFQIAYKNKINKEQLDKRNTKRPTLRNKKVVIVNAYKLKSIIFKVEPYSALRKDIINKIFSLESTFYEEINDNILILFHSDESVFDFSNYLAEKDLKFDFCPNFNLIQPICKEIIHEKQNLEIVITSVKHLDLKSLGSEIVEFITPKTVNDIEDSGNGSSTLKWRLLNKNEVEKVK